MDSRTEEIEREVTDPELRDSRAVLQKAMSSDTVGVLFFSLGGQLRDANRAFCRMTGYTREELIHSAHWKMLTAPEFVQATMKVAASIAEHGESAPYEKQMIRKDGSRWWGLFAPSRIGGSGASTECVEFIIDITKRKQAEQELTRVKSLLDTLLHRAPIGFAYFDLSLRYVMINDWLANINGIPAAEHIGKHVREIVPALAEVVEQLTSTVLKTDAPVMNHEMVGETLNDPGTTRYWNESWYPVHDSSGEIVGYGAVVEDITDRKQTEEALRRSEGQLRLFIEHAPAAIAMFDLEMRYIAASNRWKKDYGLADAIEGRSHYDLFDIPPRWKEVHSRAMAGEVLSADEDPFVRPDGTTQWIRWDVRPWRTGSGEIGGILITAEDVTASVCAKRAIREQLDLTQNITDNATTAIFMMDDQSRCTFMNPAAERMTGFRLDEIRGGILHDFIHHHHPDGTPFPMAECPIDRALPEQFDVVNHEDMFIRKNGDFFPVLVNAKPIRRDGKAVGTVIEVRDVTERKRAEALARENEAVLRAVTAEARVGLVMVAEDRRYIFANQTFAEIVDRPHAEIVGRRVEEVLPDIYHTQIKQNLDRAFAGERVTCEIHRLDRPKPGEERFYDSTYEPRQDHRGRYVVVVIVDVTERKKRQEILERTVAERTARLAETVQQLETFSYSIVHDMRAPLRSIRSFGSLLQSEYAEKLDGDARLYLERIISSVARMDTLITDVLNYSRVSAEATLSNIDLERLVTDIVEQYPEFQVARGVIHVQKPLPPVCGNTALLTQVISNLIGNALKFVPPNRTPKITIRGEQKHEMVRVWVEDNGIGIPAGQSEKIFGLFQRLHSTADYSGTGVGLAIVKKAMERMGGRVGLESEPGQGSRFWIELPAASAQPG